METVPNLFSVGINSGGLSPQNREIHETLALFQQEVIRERKQFLNDGLRVNLVFDIPGPIFQPDCEGLVAARFDRKARHLLITAAVPADLTASGVNRYLVQVLSGVVEQARAVVLERRLALAATNLELLVGRLVKARQAPAKD